MSDIVKVPDIGDFKDIPIIEVSVKPGDQVSAEQPLLVLESDKATMEVPAPSSGTVEEVLVKVGDRVSQGTPIVKMAGGAAKAAAPEAAKAAPAAAAAAPAPARAAGTESADAEAASDKAARESTGRGAPPVVGLSMPDFSNVNAAPGVRRLARELGVDLNQVAGTGDKGRVTREDVKRALGGGGAAPVAQGAGIPEVPPVDFTKFGPIETLPLTRIKKLSGPFLHRAWLNIPHVTHTDEADVTDLESFRKTLDDAAK